MGTLEAGVWGVAADVRRLSHPFFFRGNLSLVTSAATGTGIFQWAAKLECGAWSRPRTAPSRGYADGNCDRYSVGDKPRIFLNTRLKCVSD